MIKSLKEKTHQKSRKAFNSKGYFRHNEAYCDEYLRLKYAIYEKYRCKQEKSKDKFDIRTPLSEIKSKCCAVNSLKKIPNLKETPIQGTSSKTIINRMFDKYLRRKQKSMKDNENSLPRIENIPFRRDLSRNVRLYSIDCRQARIKTDDSAQQIIQSRQSTFL